MTLENRIINYNLLAEASKYYSEMGFEQIEVPWIISSNASMSTAPNIQSVYYSDINKEHFVGSAEQGFIQLLLDRSSKIIPDKHYFAISPCFRRDIPNDIYSRWFIKLELFTLMSNPDLYVMDNIILAAKQVHYKLFGVNLDQVWTNIGCDLEYKGLEIGSYGTRQIEGNTFIYGTGLALPRAQLIIDKLEI